MFAGLLKKSKPEATEPRPTSVYGLIPMELLIEIVGHVNDYLTVSQLAMISEFQPIVDEISCVVHLTCEETTGIKAKTQGKNKLVPHLSKNTFSVQCQSFYPQYDDVDYAWLGNFQEIHQKFTEYRYIKFELHLYTDPEFKLHSSQRAFFNLQQKIIRSGLLNLNKTKDNIIHIEFINSVDWFWNSDSLKVKPFSFPDPSTSIDAHPHNNSIGFFLNFSTVDGETVQYNEPQKELILATQPWSVVTMEDKTYNPKNKMIMPVSAPILSTEYASEETGINNISMDLVLLNSDIIVRPEVKQIAKYAFKKLTKTLVKNPRNKEFLKEVERLDQTVISSTLQKQHDRLSHNFIYINDSLFDDLSESKRHYIRKHFHKIVVNTTDHYYSHLSNANNPNYSIMNTCETFHDAPIWGTSANSNTSKEVFTTVQENKEDVKSVRLKLCGEFQIKAMREEVEWADRLNKTWVFELLNDE
ncbi:hypothetical protein WICPIJ_008704 [Wickerhamomyces pijperi]|uniref:Uncharacterized protein n=1 Tax=Wickerhamomyces pijperi TaxID=599730 RepID=A0A9P8PX49_WICPI|nr:hypothetical protein WICPIJ_008704 [Wickerhamomyces pijperi]